MKPHDEQLIQAELDKIANDIPKTMAVFVASTDLWSISSTIKPEPDNKHGLRISTAYFATLDAHLESNFRLGGWQQMICAGSDGLVINLPLQAACALILVMQPDSQLDELFSTIDPYYESLVKYF